VNGALELRSFVVQLYRRPDQGDKDHLLTGVHNFRLFYPENSAFLSASGDADKGEVLDALDLAKQTRRRGADLQTPAHVPYLKATHGDANSPLNASCKSVWCFEGLEPAASAAVAWRKPYRLRHVASGKYLAVHTLAPTFLETTTQEPLSLDDSEHGDKDGEGKAARLFTAALVAAEDPNEEPFGLGSRDSMVFYLCPTDETGEKLIYGVNTLRLEHQAASGETLYFVSAREPKPKLAPLEVAAPSSKICGGRVLFSSQLNAVDVLKVMPLLLPESSLIARLKARLQMFQLYTYFASTYGKKSNVA
jgi:hypothetical protein